MITIRSCKKEDLPAVPDLMQQPGEFARSMNEIEVGTEVTNLAAQQFYNKNDFTEEYVLLGMEF